MRREVIYDEVFDAQEQFRLLLDSMARPGKINVLPDMDIQPPADLNKGSAMIAFALLNTDVSFYAEGEGSDEIESYIALNTAANPVSVGEADFIFINGLSDAGIIFDAKTGTLPYPEESATFVIDVDTITEDADDTELTLTLRGPGIETTKQVHINGLNPGILKTVREQNMEFPLGVDLVLSDKNNQILCIPRSNLFEVEFVGVKI